MRSYLQLLETILGEGEGHDDRTGVGTISTFGLQWEHHMPDGFPLLTTKKMAMGWIFDELQWFLSGSTRLQDLKQISIDNGRSKPCDIWDEWATADQCAKFGRSEGDLGLIYGGLWRNFPTGYTDLDPLLEGREREPLTDQIRNLMQDLKTQPNSRRLIVTGWHPFYQRRVALPPCHTLWQLKVHPEVSYRKYVSSHFETVTGRGLSLKLYARSIDSFLGLPFNIASYALLLSLIAHATNMIPWKLVITFGDLHLYRNHIDQAKEQLSRDPKPLSYLHIDESLRKGGGIETLLGARWNHVKLHNYAYHPAIAAPIAV